MILNLVAGQEALDGLEYAMSLGIVLRRLSVVMIVSVLLLAQDARQAGTASPAQSSVQPPSTMQSDGNSSQIRDDLNKMESLNLNMSSEIEFLHDQNLQILLRTNSQMWTILIRDMRRQLQEQERRSTTTAPPRR